MNNVPYFLQHLPIWKYNLEDNQQNKNKRVKEHKVPEKWVDKAVELRQQGFKLSAIAVVVDKSTSTVWQYLKKRGY